MDTAILTNILNTFIGIFSQGFGKIIPDARHLLSILAALEVFFAAIWWAFDDGRKVEAELIKKILWIGFFVWVVDNYRWLCNIVLKGFVTTGEKAGGRSADSLLLDPSHIVEYGFKATESVFKLIHNLALLPMHKIPDLILMGLSGLLVLLAFFALAITVFLTYIEFYLVAVLGLILVPFGVFKPTAFLAEKVFGAVISYGIRLMVLAFILSVIDPVLIKTTTALGTDPSLPQLLTVLVTALTIAVLSWHAPALASSLMAGAPSLSAGTFMGTALAAGAGIAGAGVALTGAAQAAMAGVEKTRAAAAGMYLAGGGGGAGGSATAGGGTGGGGSLSTGRDATAGTSMARTGAFSQSPPQSSPGKGSFGMPQWAHDLMLARQAIPQDAHPGSGVVVSLRRE